jgi:hypothetical protein
MGGSFSDDYFLGTSTQNQPAGQGDEREQHHEA